MHNRNRNRNRLLTYIWQHSTIAIMLVALCSTTMFTTGCNTLTVVTDVQKFVPVITNVADAVCGFVPNATVCTGAVASVSASANILAQALVDYYNAQSAGAVPASILSALQQAITVFEANAANILDAVHVLNPMLQSEIEAIVAAASVLLGVIETLLPATAVTGVTLKFTANQPAKGAFSLSGFVSDYNTKVDACQKLIPRNVTLHKIHVHALALRVVTFGLLK